MSRRFTVPTRGRLARLSDALMFPIMVFFAPPGESPQLTHFWNNIRVDRSATDHLEAYAMVACDGDPLARIRRRRVDIRFHLGAWPRYVVIEPVDWKGEWYIGWISADKAGASQVPIQHRVRMLIGPEDVAFFGVRADAYEQIDLRKIGEGVLGAGGPFRNVPLH